MVCHHFLAPEQSKKAMQMVFWGELGTHREWVHMFYCFFAYFGRRDGPTFSKANFGVGTNSRLIALNMCYVFCTQKNKI